MFYSVDPNLTYWSDTKPGLGLGAGYSWPKNSLVSAFALCTRLNVADGQRSMTVANAPTPRPARRTSMYTFDLFIFHSFALSLVSIVLLIYSTTGLRSTSIPRSRHCHVCFPVLLFLLRPLALPRRPVSVSTFLMHCLIPALPVPLLGTEPRLHGRL